MTQQTQLQQISPADHIEAILNAFDFEGIRSAMRVLDWDEYRPIIEDLRASARANLERVTQGDGVTSSHSHGFLAQREESGFLRLLFVLRDTDSITAGVCGDDE